MELNELNKNANGGTELVTRGLLERLSEEERNKIQLISSRVRTLDTYKKRILHLHDLAQDPEAQRLKDPEFRKQFHALVFCSDWQYQQYRDYLGIGFGENHFVISNAIEPIEFVKKPTDKIRLIYTSTPHRGLEILVPVFDALYKEFGDKIELDVFSSFNLYGWPERDKPYEKLFDVCRQHPGINYHGFQPNDVVRKALQKANIFAYPSIWQETFCISMVEAMSAGCICVHPNLAALPEVSGKLNIMYRMVDDVNEHANRFYLMLKDLIINNSILYNDEYIKATKAYADIYYSWKSVIPAWKNLIKNI